MVSQNIISSGVSLVLALFCDCLYTQVLLLFFVLFVFVLCLFVYSSVSAVFCFVCFFVCVCAYPIVACYWFKKYRLIKLNIISVWENVPLVKYLNDLFV